MRTAMDLTGRNFGRWQVLRFVCKTDFARFWLCRCECESRTERLINQNNLLSGASRSCGCLQKETIRRIRKTHGKSNHPLYQIWQGMRSRCHKPNDRDYRHYGARGIIVCERWHDFELFLEDMESGWTKGLTIERKDVNGNYEPSNCCWITQSQQAQNTRRIIFVETPWGLLTATQAAKMVGINLTVFLARYRRGWPSHRLFSPKRFSRWDQEGVER